LSIDWTCALLEQDSSRASHPYNPTIGGAGAFTLGKQNRAQEAGAVERKALSLNRAGR
jgi:hypothetical protein